MRYLFFFIAFALFLSCNVSDPVLDQAEDQSNILVKTGKVEVCHKNSDGNFNKITIAEAGFPAHVDHGDASPGDPVPGMEGYIFSEDCDCIPDPCPATVTHAGKTYNTVLIGDQCWFKENLDVGTMLGDNNPTDDGIIEKYCYENDPANCAVYGGLYQWDEAMQYSTVEGAQGICPDGWHIPTTAEQEILKNSANGETANLVDESQTASAYTPTNSTGFSALFGGNRSVSGFWFNLGIYAPFWSSNESSYQNPITIADRLGIHSEWIEISLQDGYKTNSFAVRCLKD